MDLDLSSDSADLTATLVDVESVSGDEADLAVAIESALRELPHLSVHSDGNTVVARTSLGRPHRVIVAGHIDTVPIAGNLPWASLGTCSAAIPASFRSDTPRSSGSARIR